MSKRRPDQRVGISSHGEGIEITSMMGVVCGGSSEEIGSNFARSFKFAPGLLLTS